MLKKIPTFKSDAEAEDFVANADLTEYDLSGAESVRFEAVRAALSEDAEDLAAFEARASDPVISHQALLNDLKTHGRL